MITSKRAFKRQDMQGAVLRGDLDLIQKLVDAGEDVRNWLFSSGENLLHVIAKNKGLSQSIPLLVRLGLDVNAKSNDGQAPLHLAIINRHTSCFDALIDCGANVHAPGMADWNPLHWAICNGEHLANHFMRRLVERGADIGAFESTEKTDPLELAITIRQPNAVRALLECGYEDALGLDAVKNGLRCAIKLSRPEISSHLQAWIQSREAQIAIHGVLNPTPTPALRAA